MTVYDVRIRKDSKKPYLIEEKVVEYESTKGMRSPDRIVELMKQTYQIGDLAEENLFLLAMNTKCDVTAVFQVSKGSVNECYAGTREIFIRALLAGAVGMVLVHNHPSGDPTPSALDIQLTKTVATAGKLLGIELLDHVVVGDTWVSIREQYPDALNAERE